MANYFARKAGNIDAADVWATTPTGTASDVWSTFTTADVLHSNNFAITVNVSTTVGEVRNDNANSATAGGGFTLSNGVTLTANVFGGTTATPCVTFSGTSGNSATIVGNCEATLTAVATTNRAINNSSSGTLNIIGNCTAGNAGGGWSSHCANNASSGTLSITGVCKGGAGPGLGVAYAANNAGSGTLNITGACEGNIYTAAFNASSGSINITGNCIGGSGATAFGANNASTGTMLVVGTIEASEFIGGVGGANRGQITLLTGPFLASPTFGVNPIANNAWRWAVSLNTSTYIEVPTSDLLAKRNLVTADNVTGMPAEADVKDGVVYGPASELTGTFEQTLSPSANDIRDAVWGAATSSLTTAGSIGERLKNASTVATNSDQLAAALTAP